MPTILALNVFSNWVLPICMFAIGLGLVIFVHELGHFIAAKAVGIKVLRFSLGFGPKVVGFKRRETEYWLAAVPLGGYIKMLGQEDLKALDENQPTDPGAYNNKPVWARLIVVSAGVVMNVVFAAGDYRAGPRRRSDFPRLSDRRRRNPLGKAHSRRAAAVDRRSVGGGHAGPRGDDKPRRCHG